MTFRENSGVGIVFKKLGPWAWASNSLKMLGPELYASALWGQRKAAEKYIKIVKGHIDKQDLGWIPLSKNTNTGDPRILVDTEAYRNSITAYRKGFVYHAGVRKGAANHRGVSIADYASAHEHGWGVPKRPLWEPSYVEMGGRLGIKAIVMTSIAIKAAKMKAAGFTVKVF